MGYGEIAYNAYCEATSGKSLISGDPLPPYDKLSQAIQDAWSMAALAVVKEWDLAPK